MCTHKNCTLLFETCAACKEGHTKNGRDQKVEAEVLLLHRMYAFVLLLFRFLTHIRFSSFTVTWVLESTARHVSRRPCVKTVVHEFG